MPGRSQATSAQPWEFVSWVLIGTIQIAAAQLCKQRRARKRRSKRRSARTRMQLEAANAELEQRTVKARIENVVQANARLRSATDMMSIKVFVNLIELGEAEIPHRPWPSSR